jgi:hypothetical protein
MTPIAMASSTSVKPPDGPLDRWSLRSVAVSLGISLRRDIGNGPAAV